MESSEIFLAEAFLDEVTWAKSTIQKIMEHKIRSNPIGLQEDAAHPDELLMGFAKRQLTLATYVRRPGLSLGSPDAYMQNVATIVNYIDRWRQLEIRSANDKINEILAFKAHDWSIGLSWPDGQLDSFARYFTIRGLPIAVYLRGHVDVGDSSAYDINIATLNAYLSKVAAMTIR